MCMRRCLVGLTFCTCYLASYLTNKYVLSVLKFTYPTLFQGWQTLIGGLLLHVSWKLGWAEINSSSRSDVLTWLPASVLFVGIIYAGSRALSRLAIPVFFTLHNVAEVIICGHQKCFQKELEHVSSPSGPPSMKRGEKCHPLKESLGGHLAAQVLVGAPNTFQHIKTSPAKICSALFLLAAAGCLPFNDSQFDPDGYFWAVIHLFCVGDLLSVLDFPFLYFYRFHGSCCASGFLGFFLMVSTVKLKSLMSPGQCAAWIFFAKQNVKIGCDTDLEHDRMTRLMNPVPQKQLEIWKKTVKDIHFSSLKIDQKHTTN
eukprot:XP_028336065.1 transmembrane protein 241 isoform X6 [Physeter catodon]